MASIDIHVAPIFTAGDRVFRVLRFELREALSDVPSLSCEVIEDGADAPDPAELISTAADLTLERTDGGGKRFFKGTVTEAERLTDPDGVRVTRLLIEPSLFRLKKRADCQIFQNLSVVEIVTRVLEDAGIDAGGQAWKLVGDYPKRAYTVQYRETDLDFILRLLSEEGIYFAVHIIDDRDTVVFGDNPTGLANIEGDKFIGFRPGMGVAGAVDKIFSVSQTRLVKSDKTCLRDYNPDKPKLLLEGKEESKDPGPHALEVYQYPGRFADAETGERLAGVLLDSIQAERDVITGETGAVHFFPGLRFSIEEHPYEPINQEVLITSVRIEGIYPRLGEVSSAGSRGPAEPKYVCQFSAIPTATSNFRPPRRPREAIIPGAQTAITTGPSGEEIYTDASGQVKVLFPWDRLGSRDERSSRFMRSSQVPTGGSMLLPRVGWEVTVRHGEGDADQPYVMGRVYNAVTPPPYNLPEDKARTAIQTATTPGGGSSNEIRMTDSGGSEEMFINASNDMSVDILNNTTESVGNNASHTVGSNLKKNITNSSTVTVGGNRSVSVGGNQTIHVETFMVDDVGGDASLSIGGNRTMMIGSDHKREVGGGSSLSVGGMNIDLVAGSVSEEVAGSFSHSVGAALIEMTAGDKVVTAGGSCTESSGAAKGIVAGQGRGVEVGGAMMVKVGGAILHHIAGDRAESAGATYTEVAAGARIIKADNVIFEGTGLVSLVMGASTLTLTVGSVSIAGVSIKLDGATAETAALILDN